MLLPVREAVKDIDILRALSMVRWRLIPEPGRSRGRYRLSKSLGKSRYWGKNLPLERV